MFLFKSDLVKSAVQSKQWYIFLEKIKGNPSSNTEIAKLFKEYLGFDNSLLLQTGQVIMDSFFITILSIAI